MHVVRPFHALTFNLSQFSQVLLNELKSEFMSAREIGGKDGPYPPTNKTAIFALPSRRHSQFQRTAPLRIGSTESAMVATADIAASEREANGSRSNATATAAAAAGRNQSVGNGGGYATAAATAAGSDNGDNQEGRRIIDSTDPASPSLPNERTAAPHRSIDGRRRTRSFKYRSETKGRAAGKTTAATNIVAAAQAGASGSWLAAASETTTATGLQCMAFQCTYDATAGSALAAYRHNPGTRAAAMAVASRDYRAASRAFHAAVRDHRESQSPAAFSTTVQAFVETLSAYFREKESYEKQFDSCTCCTCICTCITGYDDTDA